MGCRICCSDCDVVDRVAELNLSFLGKERHEAATKALLRKLLACIIDTLAGDAPTNNALRESCAEICCSDADVAPVSPLLQMLICCSDADVTIEWRLWGRKLVMM